MATSTGANGGKNNAGSRGVVTGQSGTTGNEKGLSAAMSQAAFRKEYTQKIFSDEGWLSQSTKALKDQADALQRVINESKNLSKSEKDRLDTLVKSMKLVEAQQTDMFKKQEVGSKEFQKSINDAAKLRKKALDAEYAYYAQKDAELQGARKKDMDAKLEELARQTRELNAATEEVNEATKEFEKSKKTVSQGWSETISNFSAVTRDLSKVLDLHSMASNQWLDIVNQKYDVMNQMNTMLGFNTEQSNRYYGQLFGEFKDFNNNIGGLFNADDFKQYFDTMASAGITNQEVLKDNLESTLLGEKYLGLASDTITSMFSYMKLTNNNEAMNSYNKMMVSLTKQGVGIQTDTLNEIIKSNAEAADAMTLFGMSDEQINVFNENRDALLANVASQYGPEAMQKVSTTLDNIMTNLSTEQGQMTLATHGVNPFTMANAMTSGDVVGMLQQYLGGVSGFQDRDNAIAQGLTNTALGINSMDTSLSRLLGPEDLEGLETASQEVLDEYHKITKQEADQYVEQNTAMSDLQKTTNIMSTNIQDLLQNSDTMVNLIEGLSQAAFWVSIISTGIQGINALMNGINSLSNFTGGKGAAGSALGKLGTGLAIVGLTAGTIAALGNYFEGKRSEAYQNQYGENLEALKGTPYEGNESMASAKSVVSSSASMTGMGTDLSNTTSGIGYGWTKLTTSDKDTLNKALTKWMYQGGVFNNEDQVLAWAYLMNQVGSLDAMNNAIGTNFTSKDLYKIITTEGYDNEKTWNNIASILNAGWWPYKDNNKGRIKTWEEASEIWDMTKYEGYHKAGIDRVPRDNYKALLHKNEMVLNEKEANDYRAILGKLENEGITRENNLKFRNITGFDYATQNPHIKGMGGIGGFVGIGGGDADPSYKPYPITAGYPKYPSGSPHTGVDFGYPSGTEIGSSVNGTVYQVAYDPDGFGNHVRIHGDDGLYYIFGHMTKYLVNKGQRVSAGQLIGISGSTGNSTGPHLHYEVRNGTGAYGQDIDPYPYITSSLWNIGDRSGVSASTTVSTTTGQRIAEDTKLAKNTTGVRVIPGLGGPSVNKPNGNSVDRIVNSVDGVSSKIISYLDEIRKEQENQRSLIRLISNANNTIED